MASTIKHGILRVDLDAVAAWPRDAVLQGSVKSLGAGGAIFVKFGDGRLTCSKEGLLRGVDPTTVKLGDAVSVRVRAVDVARRRCSLELSSRAPRRASPEGDARDGCFRCGASGHRVRDCPRRAAAPVACFRCGADGHRARECDSVSRSSSSASPASGWDDASSLASSRASRSRRGGRRRQAKPAEPAAAVATEPDVGASEAKPASAPAAEPEGNSKERRRQRRDAEQARVAQAERAHAAQTEQAIADMLRCALARKGVSFSLADSEEILRAKLASAASGRGRLPDTHISASLVDALASCPEPPAALFRRLSSAGAA